jgi:hypothetical protein
MGERQEIAFWKIKTFTSHSKHSLALSKAETFLEVFKNKFLLQRRHTTSAFNIIIIIIINLSWSWATF